MRITEQMLRDRISAINYMLKNGGAKVELRLGFRNGYTAVDLATPGESGTLECLECGTKREVFIYLKGIGQGLRLLEAPRNEQVTVLEAYNDYVQDYPEHMDTDGKWDGTWPVCVDEFVESEWFENWKEQHGK